MVLPCLDHFPWRSCNDIVTHQSLENDLEFSSEWDDNLQVKPKPFILYIHSAIQICPAKTTLSRMLLLWASTTLYTIGTSCQFNHGHTKRSSGFQLDHWMDIVKLKILFLQILYASVDVIKFDVISMNSKV